MTSRGKFERLANAVLSKSDTTYAALIALGINAQDETIPGPFDGFCRIPSSEPPHFVWVQHTTTDRKSLRGKWLSERDDRLGDLAKAGRDARELREHFPDAKFTVVLSTNQRLSSKSLVVEVNKKAGEFDTTVDIWEQSRYARFLDSDRDGQYLRKVYLGTDAEMLSADLLAELGTESLEMYRRMQFTSPSDWVSRELDSHLWQDTGEVPPRVTLLIGESGFGKSAAAYRFLERHMDSGGYGLFIPDRSAQASTSLIGAIRRSLEELHPALLSQEASQIPTIIPADSQFVVVFDDVNRTSSATRLIRDLVSWGEPPYLIVIPVWPRFWHQVQQLKQKKGVHVITVDRMLVKEARDAIESVVSAAGLAISGMEAYDTAAKLGHDPLLIGTFGDRLRSARRGDLNRVAEDTIAGFIDDQIVEAATASSATCFKHEYRDTLGELASHMLQRKRLYPTWNEVEAWLQNSPGRLDALRDLCGHGVLCYVSDDLTLGFRHDRFLEHLLVGTIVRFLEHPSENADVLHEPYYAEWIGEALIRSPQEDAVLDLVCDQLPLAMVAATRFVGTPATGYHQRIIRKVKEWVRVHAGRYSSTVPESIRGAVAISFVLTDSPAVLEIVDTTFGLEKHWLGDFARLRNGDPRGAMTYYSVFGLWGGDDAYLLLELVRHAKLRHRERLTEGLKELLGSPDTKQMLRGAPILAGFLGFCELESWLSVWWQKVDDKARYLAEAVWASLRCTENLEQGRLIHALLAYWNELPDLKESHRPGWQMGIANRLSSVLSVEISEQIVNFLILKSTQYLALRRPIAYICGLIDLPDSIEFAVCAFEGNDDETCTVSLWGLPLRPKLSTLSVARLREVWSTAANRDAVRNLAFRLWLKNVDRDQVDVSRAVSKVAFTEPFYKNAIWERARLGDKACVPELVSILETDASLFPVASRVWCEEIFIAAEKHLRSFKTNIPKDFSGGKLDEHYHLAEMLRDVPAKDAERLLLKYWTHLCYSRLFVQAALFVGTPDCLMLAREAIAEYPDDVNPFEHLDQFFGVFAFGAGLSLETGDPPVSLRRIKNLEPYLHRLPDMALGSLAAVCYCSGTEGIEWCKKHFPDSINVSCRQRYCPTDDDLVQTLDRYLPRLWTFWLDGFEKRNDKRNPLDIVQKWLQEQPTFQRFEFAARCIEEIGSREDLGRLDLPLQYPIWRRMADDTRASVAFAVRRRTLE
jgi:hypothetical protein